MIILDHQISKAELAEIATNIYGYMVKAVIDVDRKIIAIDAELHADLEKELLLSGSLQTSLWGINLYPDADSDDFIEFDSLINIRPRQGNMGRGVESAEICDAISKLVSELILP